MIVPDLPGFGLSEKRREWDYSVSTQADAIRSLLLQRGVERTAVVCHDFGALVAAELISRAPDIYTHLVILNTSLRLRSWSDGVSPLSLLRLPILGEMAMAMSQPWMLKRAMKVYVNNDGHLTPDVMQHYWWPFDHGFKGTLINMARNRAAESGDFDRWRAALGKLAIPCLILWGADDPTFTLAEAHDLEQSIPTAQLEVFAHANHFIPEDRPHATGRLINAFLDGAF